jgi:hypothetical protein
MIRDTHVLETEWLNAQAVPIPYGPGSMRYSMANKRQNQFNAILQSHPGERN